MTDLHLEIAQSEVVPHPSGIFYSGTEVEGLCRCRVDGGMTGEEKVFVDLFRVDSGEVIIPFAGDHSRTLVSSDGSFVRARVAVRTGEGEKLQVFIRLLPMEIPRNVEGTGDVLNMYPVPLEGLVAVSGATGSGKSTFLASLIQQYIDRCPVHVVSVEDPVEYLFSDGQGYASQRELGRHAESFADGLRKALREDPDILFIGEIRDSETAQTALTAAETGHMVLATVHGSGLAGTVDRLLGLLGGNPYAALRLSQSLLCSVHITAEQGLRNYRVISLNSGLRTVIRERKTHLIEQQIEMGGKGALYA